MVKARTLVGLDVHAAKIVAAVLDVETGEVRSFRLPGDVGEAVGLCSGLARPVRVTDEAGPAGYGVARGLEQRGVSCVVCAPGKIPRAASDRVKTDRRDAEHLARLLGPASCTRSGSPGRMRRRCATWSARARTSAWISSARAIACPSCCCAMASASRNGHGP